MDDNLLNQLKSGKQLSKDKLILMFFDMQQRTVEYMGKITTAIEKLNDSNVLHHSAIEVNTTATKEMTTAVKAQQSLIKWILVALVLSLIALAGAEKVIKIIPIIK